MADFDKFLYRYLIFLFFCLFIIGLGAQDFFAGNFEEVMSSPMSVPAATGIDINRPEQGLLTGIYEYLFGGLHEALGFDTWLESTFGGVHTFFENLFFFFKLMTLDTGVAWVGTLIFAPAGLFILYGLAKLVRGTS